MKLQATLAAIWFVMVAALCLSGCATLKDDGRQILLDGHAVGKLLVQDGHAVVQLAIDGLDAYRTNDAFRASVDKDIATAAFIVAK